MPRPGGVLIVSSLVLALWCAPRILQGQGLPIEGRLVSGTVVDSSGRPIAAATVQLLGFGRSTITGPDGRFRLDSVPLGHQRLLVRAIGFDMETPALEVRSRTGWTGTVVLARKVQTLPPLEVEGEREISWRLERFEFRRKHGLGVYLTQAEIKQRNARGPLDLLKGIAGVRVFLDHGGGTRVEFTRCRESPQKATDDPSPSSKIAYWVDGVRYRGGLPGYISPAAIVGMEIYRGVAELPAEFLDDACAAVVIWTR